MRRSVTKAMMLATVLGAAAWPATASRDATLIRPAEPEDAPGIAKILGRRFARYPELLPGRRLPANEDVLQWLQTGNELLVAECGSDTVGTVRRWLDEGVYWLDLLTATRAGARTSTSRVNVFGVRSATSTVAFASRARA